VTLRRTTIVIIGATLLCLVVGLSVTGRRLLRARFVALEERDTRQNVERALSGLADSLADLDAHANEYADWDETYAFMLTPDERFSQSEFPRAATTAFRVQVVVLLDTSHRIAYAKGLDLQKRVDTAAPRSLLTQLENRPLPAGRSTGIVLLPEGPLLVAWQPIRPGVKEGPSRGTFILGRYLDSWQLDNLSSRIRLPVAAYRLDDPKPSPDVRWASRALSGETPILARPEDEHLIAGWALLDDVFGNPALVLRVEVPRTLHAEGQASIAYLTAALVLAGLVFAAATLFLLERFVLSRLHRFSLNVSRIAKEADFSARVSLPGKDELSDLAAAVNGMLEALDASREVLRAREASFRLLFASNPQTMCVFDRHTRRFLEVNEAAITHYGYAREEFLSMRIDDIHPVEDVPRLLTVLSRPASGLTPATVWTHRLKDGGLIDVEIATSAFDFQGRSATLVVARDITARRTLEDQLRHAQKMEAVGRLAGGVAHDFNNLLGIIMGYAAIVLRHLPPNDPMRSKIEQIHKASERGAALTRQLLAFSRKQVLQPKIIDLNLIVGDMESMLRRLIGENIELVTVAGEHLGRIKADLGQVGQILLNLALNARDAMPNGGTLSLETANVQLDEAYCSAHADVLPGRYVMLAVADTGSGMDAEVQKHIFDPFFTTKQEGKGTGLGLATVYGIVKQSGGYIWLYSEPDHGSIFKIYLPRIDERADPEVPLLELALPRGSETILLVEDESSLRELAREILEGLGYTVLDRDSGAAALEIAERHAAPIGLVITDVIMPGMGGREVSQRVLQLHPEAKVLFMSGYTDDAIIHFGVLETGTAFLQKPFTLDALARKVREVLDRHTDGPSSPLGTPRPGESREP
jgi:two-component system cell cycle sensor histidine kinase/response regulator CckA